MTVERIPCVAALTFQGLLVTRLDGENAGKTVAEYERLHCKDRDGNVACFELANRVAGSDQSLPLNGHFRERFQSDEAGRPEPSPRAIILTCRRPTHGRKLRLIAISEMARFVVA
jgi:hypothetical protein